MLVELHHVKDLVVVDQVNICEVTRCRYRGKLTTSLKWRGVLAPLWVGDPGRVDGREDQLLDMVV